jgi:hypothetical protein
MQPSNQRISPTPARLVRGGISSSVMLAAPWKPTVVQNSMLPDLWSRCFQTKDVVGPDGYPVEHAVITLAREQAVRKEIAALFFGPAGCAMLDHAVLRAADCCMNRRRV